MYTGKPCRGPFVEKSQRYNLDDGESWALGIR